MAASSHTRRGRRSRSFSSVNSPAAAGVMSRPRNRTMPISRDTRGRTSGRDTSSGSRAGGRARSGTIVKPMPLRTKPYSVANLVHGDGMVECKPCCRRSSIDNPAGAGVSRKRDQGGVLQGLQLNFLGAREPVPQRQHDIKGLCAKALRYEWLRHVRDISESKIRQAAVNVILDVALNALTEVDFDSREMPIVFRDDPGESDMSERHDARHDDLTSPLFGELAHVLDPNLQVVEQPLRERSELLPRFGN